MSYRVFRIVPVSLPLALLVAFLLVVVALQADFQATPTSSHSVQFYLKEVTDSNLLRNEGIRLLCYTDDTAVTIISDTYLTTDNEGMAKIPPNCPNAAALNEVETVPSGKGNRHSATIYRTSFAPNSKALQDSSGPAIVVSPNDHLILFNVVVSLAWEPAPDSDYVPKLQEGLRRASAFLFDATEGQMAFGNIHIYTDGSHWDEADIRIKAANDFRPAAYVGGILAEPYKYNTQLGIEDVIFKPAAIYFGRNWTRYGAFDEPSAGWADDDSYKTIAHEWAHYALFLYDEYLKPTGETVYCQFPNDHPDADTEVATTASIMEWHYHTSEFWMKTPPQVECFESVQFQVHGMFDWDTLDAWETFMGLGENYVRFPQTAVPMPEATTEIIEPLFGHNSGHIGYLPIISILDGDGVPIAESTHAEMLRLINPQEEHGGNGVNALSQVYLLQPANDGTKMATQIVHQGAFIQNGENNIYGSMEIVGANSESQLRIFFDQYGNERLPNGRNLVYVEEKPFLDLGGEVSLAPNDWLASFNFDWKFDHDRLTTMVITLSNPEDVGAVTFQLCVPDERLGCFWSDQTKSVPNKVDDGFEWQVSFAVDDNPRQHGYKEIPHYGIVRAFSEDGAELIQWYQVSGGVGPAHIYVDAPMVDGAVAVNTPSNSARMAQGGAEIIGPCSRIIYTPASNALARSAENALFDGNYQFISQPLDIDILMSNDMDFCEFFFEDHDLITDVNVTLFYNQDWVDSIGASEDSIQVVQFARSRGDGFPNDPSGWSANNDITFKMIDQEQNFATISNVVRDGIFAAVSVP